MCGLLFTTSLSVLAALSCSGSPSNSGNTSDVGTAGPTTMGGAGGSSAALGGAPAAGGVGRGVSGTTSASGGTMTSGGAPGGGTANAGAGGSAGNGGAPVTCPVVTTTPTTLPTLTVQLSNQYRPVTHAASGSLYGLANDGTPPDSLIGPTKPFVFTQMAPNGQQLPNGATSPIGDALKVAPAAARNGAKVTIRMPDSYPNFPYQWVSWADWYSRVDAMVAATVASKDTNIYAYEIWNEPNWTGDTADAGSFNEGWKNTYQRIKTKGAEHLHLGSRLHAKLPLVLQDEQLFARHRQLA